MKKVYLVLTLLVISISAFATDWKTNTGGSVNTLSNWVDVATGTINPSTFGNPADTWNVQNLMTLGYGNNWVVAGSVSFSGSSNQIIAQNGDTISIGGNLTMNGTGNRIAATAGGTHYYILLAGNLDLEGSCYITCSALGGGSSTFIFNGATSFSSPQTFTNNSTSAINGAMNIVVASGSYVQLQDNITLNAFGWGASSSNSFTVNGSLDCQGYTIGEGNPGSFSLASSGTIATAITPAICAVGTDSGCVRLSTARTFSASGNYIFEGTSAQYTGSGMPTSLSSPATITINNASGVLLTRSLNLGTGTSLTFTTGSLTIGNNTLTIGGVLSGTSSSNDFVGGAGSNLNIGSSSASNIYFSETTSGTTNNIDTFTVNGSGTVTLQNAMNVSGALNLYNGTLNNGSNLTLADGIAVNRDNGTLNSAPAFGSSGSGVVNVSYLNGGPDALTVTTGYELPSSTTNLGNLTINKPSATITLGNSITANGNVLITAGTLDVSASNYSISLTGNWTNNNSSSAFNAEAGSVTLNGTSATTIGGTAATNFYNLTLNDNANFTLGNSDTVNNQLTLLNGTVTLGTHNLVLGVSAPAISGSFSSSTMLIASSTGQVRKMLNSNGSFLFPVGDASANYAPVSLTITGGSYSGAYAGITVHKAKEPNNANTTDYLNRFWAMTVQGVTSLSYSVTNATYVPGDVVGTEGNISAGVYTGTLPWTKYGVVNTSTHSMSASPITYSGTAWLTGISTASPTINVTVAGAGNCNGHDTMTAVGGTDLPLTYTWSPSTGLSATTGSVVSTILTGSATYTATVTDGNGFTAWTTVSLTLPSVPTLTGLSIAPLATCVGSSITLLGTGSSGSGSVVSYNWSGPGGYSSTTTTASQSYTIPGVSATGVYSLSVTYTGAGCISSTVTSSPVSVNLPVASITGATTACDGSSVTLSDVSPLGGGSGWSSTATSVATVNASGVVTAMGAGTTIISYSIYNPGCGTTTATTTFTVPTAITETPAQTNVTCFGLSNGTATVTSVSGGTAPYTYTWTGSSSHAATATGLAAGSYTCTITDAIGCSITQAFTITQPVALSAIPSSTNNLCFGSSSGTASVAASGGTTPYTYVWNPSSAGTTASVVGLANGLYSCTVTDSNSCTITETFNITSPTAIVATTFAVNEPCFGGNTGKAGVSVSGGTPGYTYSWAPGGAATTTITGLNAGTYSCTITDAHSCISVQTIAVTQPTTISVSATTVNVACFGGSTGSLTLTVSGGTPGYTYSWSPSGGTTSTASSLTAGTYVCTVTDAHGCFINPVSIVSQPAAALTATITATNVLCHGTATGAATVNASGGTAGYTYSWAPSGGTGAVATGLVAGSYTCTVTDAHLCTTTSTITITQPTTLAASIAFTTNSCFGGSNGSATVNVTGGTGTSPYTYSWSPTGGTTATASSLPAATYSCTITDANGCTLVKTTTVTQPTAITPTLAQTNVSCFGLSNGTGDVNPVSGGTGPYTYSWSPSGGSAALATGLAAGIYACTITDAHACVVTETFNILQPAVLSATETQINVLCHGGATASCTVVPSGGTAPFAYSWSPSGGSSSIASGLVAGSYTCNITDAHGCTFAEPVTITQPTALTETSTFNPVSCHGGTDGSAIVTVSGGTPGYNYVWNPSVSSLSSALGLSTGLYTCTTTDANGCTIAQTFNITQPAAITATPIITNVSCNGGSNGCVALTVVAGGTSPYSYSWSAPGGSTPTMCGLSAGTYTCVVTDAALCSANFTGTVSQPAPLGVSSTSQTNVFCSGGSTGSATVVASGGTVAYTYSWAPTGGTAATASGLAAGTYTCTITDAHLCTFAQVFTITTTSPISATVGTTPVTCHGLSNGIATVSGVTGGTPGYSYSWSPSGGSAASASGLTAGTYSCTVTDVHACATVFTVSVTQPASLTATTTFSPASCYGSADGFASVVVSGGTTPYTYIWTGTSQTTATVVGLTAGGYDCFVTDANSCSLGPIIFTITQPTQITGSASVTNVTCFGGSNGSIGITSTSGGTGPYSYNWSPAGGSTATASALTAGSYTCTVTDAALCTQALTFSVTSPAAVSGTTTVTAVSCFGSTNGAIALTATGGTGPYTYSWAPTGGTGATATGLSAGTYTCAIADIHSCTGSVTATVTSPLALTASISSANVLCYGGSTGAATVNPAGGTGPYTYSWTPSGGSSVSAGSLTSGSYTCTVTDAHLCSTAATVTITQPAALLATISGTNTSCSGTTDGSATINPVGGTTPYSYTWIPSGGSGVSAAGLAAGTYICDVTDANSCPASASITITSPAPITASAAVSNATCYGASSGSAVLTTSGGTTPYSYSWSPTGGSTATGSSLSAGVYNCTITDANLCSFVKSVTVTQPTSVTVSVTSVTNETCFGGGSGAATVSGSGGTGAISYSWSPSGGSAATATGLSAGVYTVVATDANSCTGSATINITAPASMTATNSTTEPSCFSSSNGSATVVPSGGTTPYSYSWSPTGGSAATGTGFATGTYTCTITDAHSCSYSDVVTIVAPAILTSTVTATNEICHGGSTGTATTVASGGTAPYTYSWSPTGGTGATAAGLAAGTYTGTVTDAHACTTSQSITLTEPTAISLTNTVTGVSCFGGNNGTATVSASGGTGSTYTYSWSPIGGTASIGTGFAAGTYTCTVMDSNSCTATTVATITQPTAISLGTSSTMVSIHGGSDGTATVTPSGGTPSYTYSWSPAGGTAATATGLSAGTYTCTVTDNNGCVATASVTVSEPAVLTATATPTNVSCFGGSNGMISVAASGGVSPYTYSWSPSGGTGATATGLVAGSYTCTVTDHDGATFAVSATLTEPTALAASVSGQTNVTCNGGSNGTATASVSGGTSPYSYSWSPSGGSAALGSALSAGSYTCTVTDANGCSTTTSATITQPVIISNTVTMTAVSCHGGNNGTATVASSGGTGSTYTYSWSPSAETTATATGLTAGTYSVMVTDSVGCSVTSTIVVTQPASITAAVTTINVTCNGGNNGAASVTPSGGTSPYTYSWAPIGGTGATATGLTAGAYSVTITDFSGCSSVVIVSVAQPAAVTPSISAQSNVSCNGGSNGTATVSPVGGTSPYTYSWTPSGGTLATGTGFAAGSYTCTVTDVNGCTGAISATITQPAVLSATISTTNNVSCNGGSNGSALVSVVGGTTPYTYAWSLIGGSGATGTGFSVGNYTVNVTDAHSCATSTSVSITQPPVLTASITSTSNVSCFGGSNGSAVISSSGGTAPYSYAWAPTGGSTATGTSMSAGSFTCTVTDAHSCTTTAGGSLTSPTAVTTSSTSSTPVSISGASDGSATIVATGGAGSYTYSWSPTGGSAATATGIPAGTYTCTITDGSGCTGTAVVTVGSPAPLTATTTQTNVSCFGGSDGAATVNPTGGTSPYTYSWSPSGGTGSVATGLSAGTYSCVITDAHGGTYTATVAISQPFSFVASIGSVTEVSCNGGNNGAATVTPSGGTSPFTYAWSPSGGSAITGTGFSAGSYSVTVTDAHGCTTATTVNITQPTAITAGSSHTNELCHGGATATASVTGVSGGTAPYSYTWSPSGGTAATASGLAAGAFACSIHDANGCILTKAFLITQPTAITFSGVSQVNDSCYASSLGSATAVASGGTGSKTYIWIPTGGLTNTATGLLAGSYSLVAIDSVGCEATQTFNITQPSALSDIDSQVNVSCYGLSNGRAWVTTSGGIPPYSYAWSTSPVVTVSIATGLTAGATDSAYACTITDAYHCSAIEIFVITQPATLSAVDSQVNPMCFGVPTGVGVVTASGGTTPYSYSWSPSGGTGATATGLDSGTYVCTITDANSCTLTNVFDIVSPPRILSSNSQTNVTCFMGSDGSATIAPSGGVSPYTYLWSPSGGSGLSATGLSAGTYTCTITDANSCTKPETFNVTQPATVNATVAQINVSCFGLSDGAATLNPTGGTGSIYTFSWSPISDITNTASGLAAGIYTVTVTDSVGCIGTVDVTITQPATLVVGSSGFTNVTCFGLTNGTATVTPTGGTAPYTYSWSPSGGSAATATGLAIGGYTCSVTDAHGCTTSQTFNITQPALLTATTGQSNILCHGLSDGSATVNPSGGTTPYTYSWTPSAGTAATDTGLAAGIYTCTITDANACTAVETFSLTQPSAITSTISSTNVSCFGGSNGSATVNPTGGTPGYSYSWAPAGGSAAVGTGFAVGTYTCTITDANGCSITKTVTLTSPAAVTSTIGSQANVSCFGLSNGSVTLNPTAGGTPGYSYSWSPSGGTAITATGLAAGSYVCTITDTRGCTGAQAVTITQPTLLTATTSQINEACFGNTNASASVNPTGGTAGYLYSWTPSGGSGAVATGLSIGVYTCTITDAHLCTAVETFNITEPALLTSTATSHTNVSCFGGSNGSAVVTVAGGTSAYTYSWSPSGGATATGTGLTAGAYTCSVTDAHGCTASTTFNITQPTALTATISQTNDVCFGAATAAATVSAAHGTSPYTYSWSPSGGSASVATGLIAGVYTCTITDSNACTLPEVITITQPAAITATQSQTNVLCFGQSNGSATLSSVSGGAGTPYTYSWSPSGGSGASATGLAAGSYSCTVSDVHGCSAVFVFTITQPAILTAPYAVTDVACSSGADGSATINPAGGTTPYSYSWSPSGGSAAIGTGLTSGLYSVTVSDANGCSLIDTFTITAPSLLTSVFTFTQPSCYGYANASATVNVVGGSAPFTYSWSPSGGTGAVASGITSGAYTVTVTDSHGCSYTSYDTITTPDSLTNVVVQTNVACYTAATGSATVYTAGGTSPYSYAWSPLGGSAASASGLPAGTYTVLVTDTRGCTQPKIINILEPSAALSAAIAQTNIPCFGAADGSATVSPVGGTSPYSYSWSPSGGSSSVGTGFGAGTYTCTVTDFGGCSLTETFIISQPSAIMDSFLHVNLTCHGDSNAYASILVSGGTIPYSYFWSPAGGTGATASGLAAGIYTCTVTDHNGCSVSDTVSVIEPAAVTISLGSIPSVSPGTTSTILPYFSTSGSPVTYSISWGTVAIGAGFSNVSGDSLPATPIPVAVPFTATAGTYSGNLTVSNGTCTSVNYVINVVIGDTPPTFVNGSYYNVPVTICQYDSNIDLTSYLHISDIDSGQTETWSQLIAPNHGGSLVFTSATASSGTTNIAPTGTIKYTPSGTYNGNEIFTIQVSDGYATGNIQLTISINPTPVVTLPASLAICNGAASGALDFTSTVSGTTYAWTGSSSTLGLASSGTGNISSFTASNAGTTARMDTIRVVATANSCSSASSSFAITVNPTPTVNPVSSESICNGSLTSPVVFTGSVAGTTYNWTNSNTGIGLSVTSGVDSVTAFTGINTGLAVVTTTINVTPIANGCSGSTISFVDSVKPSGSMVAPATDSVCNGAASGAITFTSLVSGTTYSWSGSSSTIGLASTGTGSISSFTAINAGTTVKTDSITVTPSYNGCAGTPDLFRIVVKPTPNVSSVASQTLCNGATTTTVTFSSAVASATFGWTNSDVSIGLSSYGTGSISAFTASNSGSTPVVASIIVTPNSFGCAGTPDTFFITVKPSGSVVTPVDQSVCNGSASSTVSFVSSDTGISYTWSGTNSTIGLATSGTGNISSFTAVNTGTVTVLDTVTVIPTASGCVGSSVFFVFSAMPTPLATTPANQTLCNGAATTAVTFNSTVAGSTYSWTNNNFSIGLAPAGTGNISSFTALNTTSVVQVASITVTPSAGGCSGSGQTFTISVNPTPAVSAITSQAVCNGAATSAVSFNSSVSGATYTWSGTNSTIGLSSTGAGNIGSFTATNTSTITVVDTITVTPVANSCTGASSSFSITVNPTPTVTSPSNQSICTGYASTAVALTGDVPGATYSWSNNNITVGLVASGTGTIGSFTGTNLTTAVNVATITVTPSANGCTGTAANFTISVNPTPVIATPANQAICNGASSTSVVFSSSVSGSTYSWRGTNSTIGLGTTGTGNILPFTTSNTGITQIYDTIYVTPAYNSCVGDSTMFTILVNPTPTEVLPASQLVCNGAATTAATFSGAVAGTVFNWLNSNYSTGLAPSGTGNIASFTATNASSSMDSAVVTVTPVANGCSGTPHSFAISVNPTPAVILPANQAVCNGNATSAINFSSAAAGTTYTWTGTNATIGLATTGTGSISSFTVVNTSTVTVIDTILVVPTNGTCPGATATYMISVNPTPGMSAVSNQVLCNGATTAIVTFNASLPGTTFGWTNSFIGIGLAYGGSGTITPFTAVNTSVYPDSSTISVTPTANGCSGAPQSFTIKVNPTPNVFAPMSQSLCTGSSTSAVLFTSSVMGTTYSWSNSNSSIGLTATGTGNIVSFTAIDTSATMSVVDNITVTPTASTCVGAPAVFAITVNPIPTVIMPSGQAVCNGSATAAMSFSSTIPGETFSWTNSSVAVGLASSGTGNISSFTATNTGSTVLVANITVTPSSGSCSGTPQIVSVTVNPTPVVSTPPNQIVCAGALSTPVNFSGAVAGTTYAWSGNDSTIGLASTGTGNIASFTAVNTSGADQVDSITVIPSANGCSGTPAVFEISVNLIPVLTTPASQVVCNGFFTSPVSFSSSLTGTTYTWTNSNYVIGLPLSGSGPIASFFATNPYYIPEVGNITVTPTAGGCVGTAHTFAITVNPTPNVLPVSNQAICAGDSTAAVSFMSSVVGATYTWVNSNSSIGLVSTGSGNIGGFVVVNSSATYLDSTTIRVFVSANGCAGDSTSFRIFGKPIPAITSTGNQSVCNGVPTTPIVFTSSITPGTVSSWSNLNPSVGLSAWDTGTVPSFTAINTGVLTDTAFIVVTPTSAGCTGAVITVSIAVKPTPRLYSTLTPAALCDSVNFTYTDSSLTPGTSFSWSRAAMSGILNAAASGVGNISEYLDDTTVNPIAVVYVDTLLANGCVNTQNITVNIYPQPKLSSTATPSAICDKATFNYYATSGTFGTTFAWGRNTVTGLGNAASSGSGPGISEQLFDTIATPVVISYVDTLTANGCSNLQYVVLTVNPTPKLSTSLTPAAICNNNVFSYNPLSNTSVSSTVSFHWMRFWTNGISNDSASGSGNPAEVLHDTTVYAQNVTYQFDLAANGCLDTQFVTVMVNPTPRLSSNTNDSVCSGSLYSYTATSLTPGVSFVWNRPYVSGLTNPSENGTISISDTLNNNQFYPIPAIYIYTLTVNGCTNQQVLTVTVNPLPAVPVITTKPASHECAQIEYQNFGTSSPAPSGQRYQWSVVNADSLTVGAGGQYSLISFPDTGMSLVTLTSIFDGTSCASSYTDTLYIGPGVSNHPQLVFYDGYFICEESDADSYAWGYDDAATLDSTLIVGETSQDLHFTSTPDFINRYYWVITTKNGCSQKSYYILPSSGVNQVAQVTEGNSLKLYPNPVDNVLNIKLLGKDQQNVQVMIFDLLGRQVMSFPMDDNNVRVDVAQLFPGTYVLGCYVGGVKVGSANFIKQ